MQTSSRNLRFVEPYLYNFGDECQRVVSLQKICRNSSLASCQKWFDYNSDIVNGTPYVVTLAFHWACTYGSNALVRHFLDQGTSPNVLHQGRAALGAAASRAQYETVVVLLKAGADINAMGDQGQAIISAAAAGGHRRIMSRLWDKIPRPIAMGTGLTAMNCAAHNGLSSLRFFAVLWRPERRCPLALSRLRSWHYNAPLSITARFGHIKAFDFLLRRYGSEALNTPSGERFLSIVSYMPIEARQEWLAVLMQHKFSLDLFLQNHQTLLTHSIIRNEAEMVRWLLNHGADVNKGNRFGMPPLHSVVRHYDYRAPAAAIEIFEAIAEAGPDFDIRWGVNNATPLHAATEVLGHPNPFIELLLRHGATPTLQDSHYRTPLMNAAQNLPVRYLLIILRAIDGHECDGGEGMYCGQRPAPTSAMYKAVNKTDASCWSALGYAVSFRPHDDIVRELFRHGAEPNVPFLSNQLDRLVVRSRVLFLSKEVRELLYKYGVVPGEYSDEVG